MHLTQNFLYSRLLLHTSIYLHYVKNKVLQIMYMVISETLNNRGTFTIYRLKPVGSATRLKKWLKGRSAKHGGLSPLLNTGV